MHVVWIHALARATGGAERYVRDTARHLAARGVTSTLLYDPNLPAEPGFLAGFAAAFPLVDPRAQLARLRPDVVYVHRLPVGVELAPLLAGPAPVIRFLHDHALFCLREHKVTLLGGAPCARPTGLHCYAPCGGFVRRDGLVRLATLHRRQHEHRDLAAIVVGSGYLREHALAHALPAARIHTLPLYAEAAPLASIVTRCRDRILFAGQLVAGKGADLLLRALRGRRVHLDVLGDGPERERLGQLARGLGVADRVHFHGQVTAGQVAGAMARARAVVVPSRVPETFGLAGLEALATGAPLIGAAVGGVGEYLRDGETGLAVPPDDEPALGAALDRVVDDDLLAGRLGASGHALHRARFLPAHHLDGLHRLFGQVATRRAA